MTMPFTQAMRIDERLRALGSNDLGSFDPALARRRFRRWRESGIFGDRTLTKVWMESHDTSSRQLLRVLGTNPESTEAAPQLQDVSSPENTLDRHLKGDTGPLDLIRIAECFVENAMAKLRRQWPLGVLTPESLFQDLLTTLHPLVNQVAVLELHIARHEGHLNGSDGTERFASFVDSISTREGQRAILERYPVLCRRLQQTADDWVEARTEIAVRLHHDLSELEDLFGELGDPVAIRCGEGDTHCRGRSVAIVEFSTGRKIVYKPRPLQLDEHFHQLLEWFNTVAPEFQFGWPRTLCKANHGWVQFVQWQGCAEQDQIDRFYFRLGGLLGLTWILGGTDFHHENLIACGEHPILIDLETLLQPALRPDHDIDPTWQAFAESVMGTGLLPERSWSSEHHRGVDLSGILGSGGQDLPDAVPSLSMQMTDETSFEPVKMTLDEQKNRPRLNGETVPADQFQAELARGLRSILEVIRRRPQQFLARLSIFEHDTVRVLVRDTRIYQLILHGLTNPKTLRCGLEQSRVADHLWSATAHEPWLQRLVRHEQASIFHGDVPYFTTTPTSLDLRADSGHLVPAFLNESLLDSVRRRVEGLTTADIDQQVWITQASLASADQTDASRDFSIDAPPQPAEERIVVEQIVERLVSSSSQDDTRIGWLGLEMVSDVDWGVAPVPGDLYEGLSGIALMLAFAAEPLQRPDLKALARKTIQMALERDRTDPVASVGIVSGRSALVYTLAHVGGLWNDDTLLDDADRILREIAERISQEREFDIIEGVAGVCLAALALHAVHPRGCGDDVANRAASHLLEQAKHVDGGLCWFMSDDDVALTGLSHGASGIALALARVARVLDRPECLEAAIAATDWERTLYDPDLQNWVDLRPDGSPVPIAMTAWCHGAAGIALARAELATMTDDPGIDRDLEAAVESILRHGFDRGSCLCHGGLGNALMLDAIAQTHPHWRPEATRAREESLQALNRRGFRCGTPWGVETPGLMTGIAGTGWVMLHWMGASVPSLLGLEAPRARP